MAASNPDEVIRVWTDYFNARDLEGLASMYEEDAVFIPTPGQVVTGRPAIRDALKPFIDTGGTMSIVEGTSFAMGNIALTHNKWRLEVPGADAMEGSTAEVVRRQADGSWKYAIDNPYGS